MKFLIISTSQTPQGEWLAFSCWYSIHRNLPHVPVGLIFPRGENLFQFNWLRRCGVPFGRRAPEGSTVIPDTTVLVRPASVVEIVPAGSPEPAAFVDASRVGKFVLTEWGGGPPFHRAGAFWGGTAR